jgi:glycosyltransferase involved in cell wall biosynthesis
MPAFSIIMPCFDAAATLPETLAAITAQTDPDWELICVDDGSCDETCAIVVAAAFRDPRVRLLRNPGKGPSAARNHGALVMAQGDILAFCDADDLWAPGKLMALRAALDPPEVDGVFARVAFFDVDPCAAGAVSCMPTAPLSVAMLMRENPVCTMSNMSLRRTVFVRTGGFDEDMVQNEDLEWLIRLVGEGARVIGLHRVLVWYRASPGGLSADLGAMRRGRDRALATARRLGFTADPVAEAVHLRYLARRALRLDAGGALGLALAGMRESPLGFLRPMRRGGATLIAAMLAPLLPRALRRTLFSR